MILNIFKDGEPIRVYRFVRNIEADTTVFATELTITLEDGTVCSELIIHGDYTYTIRKEFEK